MYLGVSKLPTNVCNWQRQELLSGVPLSGSVLIWLTKWSFLRVKQVRLEAFSNSWRLEAHFINCVL